MSSGITSASVSLLPPAEPGLFQSSGIDSGGEELVPKVAAGKTFYILGLYGNNPQSGPENLQFALAESGVPVETVFNMTLPAYGVFQVQGNVVGMVSAGQSLRSSSSTDGSMRASVWGYYL